MGGSHPGEIDRKVGQDNQFVDVMWKHSVATNALALVQLVTSAALALPTLKSARQASTVIRVPHGLCHAQVVRIPPSRGYVHCVGAIQCQQAPTPRRGVLHQSTAPPGDIFALGRVYRLVAARLRSL